jgi:hypothetical protein
MKDAVVRQPDKPVAQVYQEEQSKKSVKWMVWI